MPHELELQWAHIHRAAQAQRCVNCAAQPVMTEAEKKARGLEWIVDVIVQLPNYLATT